MAINITDSTGTIKLEITSDYSQTGYPTIPAQTRYIEKAILSIKSIGDQLILFDGQTNYSFLYSDITTPSGATAAAIAALVEAFTDETWSTWIPTFAGFSADPTNVVARYIQKGKTVHWYVFMTSGTSNATTKTMSLPVPAANTQVQTMNLGNTVDNGTNSSAGVIRTIVNSSIANVYKGVVGGAFTNSGTCGWAGRGTYEAA